MPPDLPGYPSRNRRSEVLRIDDRGRSSIVPALMREAKSARFSISLFLLAGFVLGAYYLGREAGYDRGRAEHRAAAACEEQERNVQRLIELRRLDANHLTVIEGQLRTVTTELAVMKTHLEKK